MAHLQPQFIGNSSSILQMGSSRICTVNSETRTFRYFTIQFQKRFFSKETIRGIWISRLADSLSFF